MCNCIHHIISVSFFINYTKDSQKCSHARWMEVCLFISRGHHASSTHSYSGSRRMCAIHTHFSHVRSIVSMSNCHNNSQTVRCFCIENVVMDLPVDNMDIPFSTSRCCNHWPTTRIVCIESMEDSLWCYNTCVSVQCCVVLCWTGDNFCHRFVSVSWISALLQEFPVIRDLFCVTIKSHGCDRGI